MTSKIQSKDPCSSSEAFALGRGVRQGDFLSPILLNMLIDRLIKKLSVETGYRVGSARVNCLAFTADLILCAQKPDDLTDLLDTTASFLGDCGLVINTAKSLAILLKDLGKQKKCVVERRSLKIHNRKLPYLNRNDT